MSTQGEKTFEDFCYRHKWKLSRIDEEDEKRPDYQLFFDSLSIIIEVKDLEENEDEKNAIWQFKKENTASWGNGKPGRRIRNKIDHARCQLKYKIFEYEPAMLVLYDNRSIMVNGVDLYSIKAAMYGTESYQLFFTDEIKSPLLLGKTFNSNDAKLKKHKNCQISALSILHQSRLQIFHNIFASNPIHFSLFSGINDVEQFTLEIQDGETFSDWIKI